jgi:hypothetical protein
MWVQLLGHVEMSAGSPHLTSPPAPSEAVRHDDGAGRTGAATAHARDLYRASEALHVGGQFES